MDTFMEVPDEINTDDAFEMKDFTDVEMNYDNRLDDRNQEDEIADMTYMYPPF